MGYAELIERLQELPQDKQAEVFDFVEFLAGRMRDPHGSEEQEWSEQEFNEMAMAQALRGMDEDVVYTLSDLRERWA